MSVFHSEFGAHAAWPVEATRRMNRMYRRQRHIYDGTRRYYLLGRDQLIAGLRPAAGASVLEIGCGTGRNLVLAARQYPDARFFGVDVSTEMLTSAISAISRGGLSNRIRVAHGDATAFDPAALFGVPSFDHVMISYSLSMIPDWRRVLDAAASRLKAGGQLHIVDFGDQEAIARDGPRAVARLARDVRRHAARRASSRCCGTLPPPPAPNSTFERPFRGYAQTAVLKFPRRRFEPAEKEAAARRGGLRTQTQLQNNREKIT